MSVKKSFVVKRSFLKAHRHGNQESFHHGSDWETGAGFLGVDFWGQPQLPQPLRNKAKTVIKNKTALLNFACIWEFLFLEFCYMKNWFSNCFVL